ncbi:MAG: HAD family hydrolase [Alphaproteobacteria bacterium]
MKKLIIFDCDGVLVDSEPISCRIVAEAFTAVGYPISTEDYIHNFVGKSITTVMKMVTEEHGLIFPDGFYWEGIKPKTIAAFEQELQPIDGIIDVLSGVTLPKVIASSSELERIKFSLRKTGVIDHFEEENIYSAQMVKRGKPFPDLFLHVAAEQGVDPADCLIIEDSVAGVQAATAAGIDVLGFTGGSHIYSKPDHAARLTKHGAKDTFSKMSDLLSLF